MNQLESAALTLAGVTLAFLAVAFAIWRLRQRSASAPPRSPRPLRTPGEGRVPKLARKPKPDLEVVEISPSRLARIRGDAPLNRLREAERHPAPTSTAAIEDGAVENILEAMASSVEADAHRSSEEIAAGTVALRLVPQIPLRDAISTHSWLGGRPRLPAGIAWPKIDDQPADFLAQIGCADLPRDLWGGLGPREGSLAFFIHRRDYAVRVLHLRETGLPVALPFTLNDPEGWFGPHGGLGGGDLAQFAVRAFPEWPVDLIAVHPGDAAPRADGNPNDPTRSLYHRIYDIADPAFHPFDWGSLIAMATLLKMRLDRLTAEAAPPPGADAEDVAAMARCAAINRNARERAEEIVAIVHDSATRDVFSAGDTAAVMAALHAIPWAKGIRTVDVETGAERIEMITLPLTTHRADADLWVHDYQTMFFDRAKHAWCANPDNLSAPTRAFYEPCWRELAASEMAAMGHEPFRHVHDYDDERDAILLELPTSGLMSWMFGDGDNLVVTIDKADLAIGDFSKVRAQVSN